MSENEIVDTGIELPRMTAVEPLPSFTLRVEWAEGPRAGGEDLVDIRPIIFSYKIYKPLRDEKFFQTGRIAEDGNAVAWDDKDLVMSADMIQSLAAQVMTPKDFSLFMARNKLTQEGAAAVLGRSRRQIATYALNGPIPRVVALACYGYEAHRRDAAIAKDLHQAAASLATPEVKPVVRPPSGKAA